MLPERQATEKPAHSVKVKKGGSGVRRVAGLKLTTEDPFKDIPVKEIREPLTTKAGHANQEENILNEPDMAWKNSIDPKRHSEPSNFYKRVMGHIQMSQDYTDHAVETQRPKAKTCPKLTIDQGAGAFFVNPEKIAIGDLIGHGAYGQVYKGLNKLSGDFIAVKQLSLLPSIDYHKQMSNLENEINILKSLKHPNIVRYLGSSTESENLNIYMEYMPGGSVSSLLKQYGAFSEGVIRNFTRQILQGLIYLHDKRVVHKDLKGGNILSDGSGHVKLADFGAARHLEGLPVATTSGSEICQSVKGSLYWMAPEMLREEGHGRKIDIWSLGCTVIEMATGVHPWPHCKTFPQLVLEMMEHKCPPIPDTLSKQCRDFIMTCCRFDKRERPRAKDLMKHPFLRK